MGTQWEGHLHGNPISVGGTSSSACLFRAFGPAALSPVCLFQLVRFWLWTLQSPRGIFWQCCQALGIPISLPSLLLTVALGFLPGCPSGTFKASQGDEGCIHCPINSRTTSEGATNCVCRNGYYRADADPVDMPCTSTWALGNWGGWHTAGKGDISQSTKVSVSVGFWRRFPAGHCLKGQGAQSPSSGVPLQWGLFLTMGQFVLVNIAHAYRTEIWAAMCCSSLWDIFSVGLHLNAKTCV